MKIKAIAIAVIALLFAFSTPPLRAADGTSAGTPTTLTPSVDRRCVKDCVNAGTSGPQACLASCSYYDLSKLPKRQNPNGTNRQFLAPVPVDKGTVVNESTIKQFTSDPSVGAPAQPMSPAASPRLWGVSKDYQCYNQCLQYGYQSGLCEQKCTKH